MSKKKVICVVGPTASGKTGLGVKIAKLVGGEVISADSMQIYKDMHIASAAVDESETEGVPHHLIEFLEYGESFTVFDFLSLARKKTEEIIARGNVPILVGGTGLYINSFVDNIELTESKTDFALRKELEDEFDRVGGEAMLECLRKIDPKAAEKLHTSDKRRIVRAFEIYRSTGMTKTEQDELSKKNESPYDAVMIGLTYDSREMLYDRINLRVDLMVKNGLVEEAKRAFERQNGLTSGAVQAIGHKELFPYFRGEISLEEATEKLKQQTRRYAKRQLTWFNARNDIDWIYSDIQNVDIRVKEILKERDML